MALKAPRSKEAKRPAASAKGSHDSGAAIRDACTNIKSSDISGAVLYASMSPCIMCLSSAMWAGVERIVFACPQTKVSHEYYGGHYDTVLINQSFTRSLKIEHMAELEEKSLAIVKAWEQKIAPPPPLVNF